MKRLIPLCLMTCLSLPMLAIGVMAVSIVAAPVAAYAEAEIIDDDASNEAGHEGDHDAAGGHDDEAGTPILSFDVGSAFWNLVIFAAVLAILSLFVWPNVLHGLQAREDKIREDLESAEKANADAQGILASYQSKLDEASTQVQQMLADARRDAEENGQKIVEQAKMEAATQRERAVADIDNAKNVAMAELAGRTSDMAIQVARSVVGRELSADDHAELIKQAMERLPSQN